jgi:hypothetical protein
MVPNQIGGWRCITQGNDLSTEIAVITKIVITRRGMHFLSDDTKTIERSAGSLDGMMEVAKRPNLLLLLFAPIGECKLPEVDNLNMVSRRSIHIRFAQSSARERSCCTQQLLSFGIP